MVKAVRSVIGNVVGMICRVQAIALTLFFILAIAYGFAGCGEPDKGYKEYHKFAEWVDSSIYNGNGDVAFAAIDSMLATKKNMAPYGKAVCYAYRGRNLSDHGRLEAARRCLDTLLDVFEKTGLDKEFPEEYTHTLLETARILSIQQKYNETLEYYMRAKRLSARNNCTMSDYSYYMAMMLYKQQKYDQAIRYFNESFFEAEACSEKLLFRMQEVLDNIGLSYHKLRNWDSSALFYDSTLSFLNKHEAKFVNREMGMTAKGLVYRNMGTNFFEQGQYDSAIHYFKKCISECPRTALPVTTTAMASIADIYLGANKYHEALAALQELDSAMAVGYIPEEKNSWQEKMVRYYKGTRQFEKATELMQQYYQLKDSIAGSAAATQANDVVRDVKDKEQQYQISLLKKDNELNKLYLWITLSCSALFIVIIVLVFYNYRLSHKKSAQIKKQNEELEQLNREKDKILGVVAHDLRNPIGVISYLSDLMIEDGDERPQREKESLGMVHSATQHSLALINELLELKSGKPVTVFNEKVDLAALSRECEAILQFRLKGKDQQMVIEKDDEPMIVQGNSERLSRLMQNLLTNAIKFSYPGDTIMLKLQRRDESVLLSVIDTGIGIPADMQQDLLNTFTGARRTGTSDERSFGLGLSISKQIVDEHKARIWFESEEGKGTTFFVELRLAVE